MSGGVGGGSRRCGAVVLVEAPACAAPTRTCFKSINIFQPRINFISAFSGILRDFVRLGFGDVCFFVVFLSINQDLLRSSGLLPSRAASGPHG
jgi:hypothetical protein